MSLPMRPPDKSRSRFAAVAVALLLLVAAGSGAGCAMSSAMQRGRQAEIGQDYDRAVAEYTKALRLQPNNVGARTALERAKLRAAADHYQRGRRFAAAGKYEEALVE